MFLAPRGSITEAASGRSRRDHVMVGEREETEVAPTDCNLGVGRLGDDTETHHWQATPRRLGGEEAPVVEHVAAQRIAHIVRCQSSALEGEKHFARSKCRRRGRRRPARVANIAPFYLEVHVSLG